MKNILKVFDKYTVCVWAIVVLLVAAVVIIPFAPGYLPSIFGLRIPLTPVLVLMPILMGILYALIVSYEQPKMSKERKNVFRILKAIDFVLFYALTITTIVYAAVNGMIRF